MSQTSYKILQEDGSALLQESGDFILLEQQSFIQVHSIDSLLKTIETKSHTTDTLLRKARTDTHTTDSSIEVGFVTIEKAHTTDSLLRASQNKTHTTNSLLRGQEQKAHTTNTLLRKSNNLTHTTDALKRNRIEIPLWVSPADEAIGIPTSHFLVFEMPESISDMHFHIQVDTAPTFDVSLQEFKSWQDQTNWQYFNGTDWVSMPAGGVSNSFSGNQARLAVNLDPNTYYRRARARIEVA